MPLNFKAPELIRFPLVNIAFTARYCNLLADRIHAGHIRQQQSTAFATLDDDTIAFDIQLIRGIDRFRLRKHIDVIYQPRKFLRRHRGYAVSTRTCGARKAAKEPAAPAPGDKWK